MIRNLTVFLALSTVVACQSHKPAEQAHVDFTKDLSKALPKTARCSQVSEIEKISVRETLLIKFNEQFVSGTYHFATGEKSTLNDAGFQHLSGQVSSIETKDSIISVSLNKGSLSVYFDEEFAPEKKLVELRFDLNEKKISFLLDNDTRETVVSGCTFQ